MRPILIPLDLHERCQIDVLCWWKMYFLTQRKIWDLRTEDPKWDYKFVVYYISVQVSKLIFSESDFYPNLISVSIRCSPMQSLLVHNIAMFFIQGKSGIMLFLESAIS